MTIVEPDTPVKQPPISASKMPADLTYSIPYPLCSENRQKSSTAKKKRQSCMMKLGKNAARKIRLDKENAQKS